MTLELMSETGVLSEYHAFLQAKTALSTEMGFPCEVSEVNPILKPHQADMVVWAVRGGRRALFTSFGLGKTVIQLEIIRLVLQKLDTSGRGLIVLPLGVRQEFKRDAAMLGIPVRFIRSLQDLADGDETVRDGKLDPRAFDVVSLDEAGVLRGFGGTKSKTRWFKRDSEKADHLTLHPHKAREFWLWVASWAIFVQAPSDLGYDDTGYDLPPLAVRWHLLPSDHSKATTTAEGQGRMFVNSALGVVDASREKRSSLDNRVAKVLEIVTSGREGTRREEAPDRALQGVPARVSEVLLPPHEGEGGLVQEDTREEGLYGGLSAGAPRLDGDADGPLAGEGLRADEGGIPSAIGQAGLGMPDLHSDASQASGESRPYDREGQGPTLSEVQRSAGADGGRSGQCGPSSPIPDQIIIWCDLNDEQRALEDALIQAGISASGMTTIVTDVVRENNQTYRLGWTEQCKDGTKMGVGMPEYLIRFRKPPTDRSDGYADVPVVKAKPLCEQEDGTAAVFDKKTNWRRPIPGTGYSRGRWQLDAHGFWRSDGNRLLSREELWSLSHAALYQAWRDRSSDALYDFEEHVQACEEMDYKGRLPAGFMELPPHSWHEDVWTDITRMRTLNGSQWSKGKELHVCPLQLDIVDRVINQMTMPGELVFDPFSGLGTVALRALKLGRRGLGVELAPSYHDDAVAYLQEAERQAATPTLFDLLRDEEVSA